MSDALTVPAPIGACLKALMESLGSHTAILDASGVILAVNPVWASAETGNPLVYGLGPGSDYGETCRALITSLEGGLSIVALGLLQVLKGGIAKLSLDYPCGSRESLRWFGVTAIRIPGDLPLCVIHHQDITERVEARRRLHRIELLFKATTENGLDLIAILDDQKRLSYASPSYAKVLGYSPQDWEEEGFLEKVHAEDRALVSEAFTEGFTTGLSPLFEYRFAHRNGSWRCFEGRVAIVENAPGERDRLLLVARDITARKSAQAERDRMEVQLRHAQKMEAIGQLAAGIAHEINTPVQYINDNLRFLEGAFQDLGEAFTREEAFLQRAFEDTLLSSEARALSEWVKDKDTAYILEEAPKALQQSQEGVRRVATIIQAMKVFSHPGTEGRSAVDLNRALENTVLVARNEWKYVAELELDLDPDLPEVEAYPGEINQAFLNLIVNAAHAIEEMVSSSGDKGVIRIETRGGGEWVEIRIQDTGCGIPEPIQSRVFDPFFTTKVVGKGTGQGLSIVHSVVTKHGGTIRFETKPGMGTCFIVRLPTRPSA